MSLYSNRTVTKTDGECMTQPSFWGAWQGTDKYGTGAIAESLHLLCELEAERKKSALVWVFQTSKSPCSDTPPSTRSCLLIFPKTVPPIRDQVFKFISLWGSFSFKLPQLGNIENESWCSSDFLL